ncbi:hypothetical protein CMO91_00540 [Candidatus Woesearchaeota archaeon]|nr:hypothetical protein [Candidatus Woesearchaeota archaeon]
MKKAIVLLLCLSVLIGCAGGGEPQGVRGGVQENFRVGSEGIRMFFTPGVPTDRLFDTEEFNALVELENVGAHDAGAAGDRVYLSGFDSRVITGIPSGGVPIPPLEGKNQFNPRGSRDTVSFKGQIAKITGDVVPQPLLATLCYRYKTEATTNVCIDPDPFSPGIRTKVCEPGPVGLGDQAAPVAVTNIEVEPRRGKTGFRIRIRNVGGGAPFRNDASALGRCNPQERLKFNEVDFVEVTDVKVGGISVRSSCRPLDRGHVRLDPTSGQGEFYCEFTTTGSATFLSPITIDLTYGYRSTIQHSLVIIKTDID